MFVNNLANFIFVALVASVVLVALIAVFYFWNQPTSLKNEVMCPICKKRVTLEKLEEKALGVFRKGESKPSNPFTIKLGSDNVKMVWYQKFETGHRCPNCGYEWRSTEVRRV